MFLVIRLIPVVFVAAVTVVADVLMGIGIAIVLILVIILIIPIAIIIVVIITSLDMLLIVLIVLIMPFTHLRAAAGLPPSSLDVN